MEIYLLLLLVCSILMFGISTIIMCYKPFKNERIKYVIYSIFSTVILFSIISYLLYVSNLTMGISSILIIGFISSVLLTLFMFYENLFGKQKIVNKKEIVSLEDIIGLTGEIVHILDPENDDENMYLGKLGGNKMIILFSIEKLEINDIFRVTEFKNNKFYCVLNKEDNEEINNN